MRNWLVVALAVACLAGTASAQTYSPLQDYLRLPPVAPPADPPSTQAPQRAEPAPPTPAASPTAPPPAAASSNPVSQTPAVRPTRAAAPTRIATPLPVSVPPRPAVRAGYVVPKGSRVALPLVEGYIEAAASIGLVNEAADSVITIADLPSAPADQIEAIIGRALRLQPGVRIEKTETITRTDGTSAPLVTARRVAGGNIYTLMGIGVALPEALAIVTISARRDGPVSEQAARDILLQTVPALDSEVTTPDQLLVFAANPPPPLRYVTVVPTSTALYTIGSVKRPGSPAQPLLAIAFSRQPPPPDTVSAADLARLVMVQIGALDKIAVRSVSESRLAGYPASQAIADGIDRNDGNPRRIIQWLAAVPDGQLVAYGIARPEDAEAAFAAFRAATTAIAMKPVAP